MSILDGGPDLPTKPTVPQRPRVTRPDRPAPPANDAGPTQIARRAPPKQLDRALKFSFAPISLTGFYEALPAAGENSAFTMQINQVGNYLIGWVSQVPDCVGNVSAVQTMKIAANTRCGYMTFETIESVVQQLDPMHPGIGVLPIRLTTYPGDAREPFSIRDPDSLFGGQATTAQLRIECIEEAPYLYPERGRATGGLHSDWHVTGICFDSLTYWRRFDSVKRISNLARLPYSMINLLAPGDDPNAQDRRDALIGAHICPLPESFVVRALREVTRTQIFSNETGLTTLPYPPAAEDSIAAWQGSDSGSMGTNRRNVLHYLTSFVAALAPLPTDFHRRMLISLFIDHSSRTYRNRLNYHDIYLQAVADELGPTPALDKVSWLYPLFASGVLPGLAPGAHTLYRYTLTFTGGSTGAITKEAAKTWWPARLIPVAFGAATFNMKCDQVELDIGADDKPKIDPISGNPVVKRVLPGSPLRDSANSKVHLNAGTITFGLFPTLPGPTEVFTVIGDLQYGDFAGADFTYLWGQPLDDVHIGPYATIKTPQSGFVDMTLPRRGNLRLFGSTTQILTLQNDVTKTFDDLTSGGAAKKAGVLKDFGNDVRKKGLEGAAEQWLDSLKMKDFVEQFSSGLRPGTVSVGMGRIFEPGREPADAKLADIPFQQISTIDIAASSREGIAYYEKDRADIDDVIQKGDYPQLLMPYDQGRRLLVERILANNLALILNPYCSVELQAHASPEGPLGPLEKSFDPYNQTLSEDRMTGVMQAILDGMDAYYTRDQWGRLLGTAFGEERARSAGTGGGGSADPPGTTNRPAFANWVAANGRQVDQWPDWRKVDVIIGGAFAFRLCD